MTCVMTRISQGGPIHDNEILSNGNAIYIPQVTTISQSRTAPNVFRSNTRRYPVLVGNESTQIIRFDVNPQQTNSVEIHTHFLRCGRGF